MSHDRQISVGACWLEDTSAHVEEVWAGVDEPAAVEWVVSRAGRRMLVVIDSQSPAASMIPALKAVTAHFGNDPQWRTVRPPLTELTPDQERQVITELKGAGFSMPGL